MADWSGIVKTNAPKYLKGFEDNTMRDRKWLAKLKSKGRVMMNKRGSSTKWQVQAKEPTVEDYADGGIVDYSRLDLWQQAELDWRGYMARDAQTIKEELINAVGETQLIDRYKQIVPNLAKAMANKIGLELYVDGNATGNANRFHGIESFCGVDTSYGTGSSGAVAADKIAKPSDTYAGLSTAPGAIGGSWSDLMSVNPNASLNTDWPYGVGSPEYDYWTPKLVNYLSNSWTGSTGTWATTCERVLRETSTWCRLTDGVGIDEYILGSDLYIGYLNAQANKQRILVGSNSGGELGFDSSYTQEGVKLSTEYGIAASVGYGICYDAMEMLVLGSQLFTPRGPDYSPHTPGWLFFISCFGNLRFNPKNFAKIYGYAST